MTQLEPINIIRSEGTDREMPLIIYRRLYFTAVRLSPRRHFSPVVVSECYIDIAVTWLDVERSKMTQSEALWDDDGSADVSVAY